MLAHAISHAMGAFANHQFTPLYQSFINKSYVTLLGLNMDEFAQPSSYSSLQALFTRELKISRVLDKANIICPSDSYVMAQGVINNDTALQIKGKEYAVSELLDNNLHNLGNGTFINFYLSPKDYHRYHAPCDMQIINAKHIPGELFPVNRPALNFVRSLFAKNERVVLECKYNEQTFYLVMIGALNVGKMKFNFDANIQTNAKKTKNSFYAYENLIVQKGDELGYFELGSTVVALFPKDFANFCNLSGQSVKFGQGLSID